MYNFERILVSYEYCSYVTHEDGHKSSFRKVEHIEARRDKSGFLFTFNGSEGELFDGKEPEDWASIYLTFGKSLYPYTLRVTADGQFTEVLDFDNLKQSWMAKRSGFVEYYEYNTHVKDLSYNYMYTLESERMFLSILRRNIVFNLLFWKDDKSRQELEIQDFPTPQMLTIFSFEEGKKEKDSVVFKTESVYDEGNKFLVSGDCTINIRRDEDGMPGEISLIANVERLNYGYFQKEITLRRL